MRAVLYARVSSDDRGKDGRNLDGQIEMAREYAEKHGYKVINALKEDDRCASGASFELEQLNLIRDMAADSEFDVLIVHELDRLSRNLAKQLIVEEELKRHGVKIEYVLGEYPDTPEGDLMKNIRATIAEYERLKISERNTRGRRNKVKAGHVLPHGKAPYGYKLAEVDGKSNFEIVPGEADIIRLIFQWYISGNGESGPLTFGEIAEQLTALGVPTAKDTPTRNWGSQKKRKYGEWCRGSVQKIIKNPTYKGDWHYGKKAKINGHWQSNPDDHILTVKVPAIISPEVWDIAIERRADNKANASRDRKRFYLLSGLVTCDLCGRKIAGTTVKYKYHYYRCGGAYGERGLPGSNLPMFRAPILESMIWNEIHGEIIDPVRLANGLNKLKDVRDREPTPLRERLNVIADLIEKDQSALDNLMGKMLDVILAEKIPEEILVEKRQRLETNIESLKQEKIRLLSVIQKKTLTKKQLMNIQEFAAKIKKGLEVADTDDQSRRQALEDLSVQVTLTVEDDQKVVYLHWLAESRSLLYPPTPPPLVLSDNTTSRGAPAHTRRKLSR